MTPEALKRLTKKFSLDVFRFYRCGCELPGRLPCARSRADFVSNMTNAEEEADETFVASINTARGGSR